MKLRCSLSLYSSLKPLDSSSLILPRYRLDFSPGSDASFKEEGRLKYRIKWSWNIAVNIVLALAFVFVAIPRIEMWIFAPKMEGQVAPESHVLDLLGHERLIPKNGRKQIVLFWATWCGPCAAELALYNRAVKEKKLPAQQVLAVSLGESVEVVQSAVRERGYEFSVYVDPVGRMSQSYQVPATPTSVFVEKTGKIATFSVGLSPFTFLKAEEFLKERE